MKTITLSGPDGRKFRFKCEDLINGVPINPVLPPKFDSTPNEARSDRSRAWWCVPFVIVYHDNDPKFVAHWKGNTRFDVRCLDGGAWDRSTVWGMFGTLNAAVALAAVWRRPIWMIPSSFG